LDGIPPAPRGMPQVEVMFDIDANGMINVTAKDKATNKEQKITVQGGTGLSKDEIEKMVNEAEKHSDEDKSRKEKVEAKNIADGLCYTAEKSLKDAGDKVPEDVKKEIQDKIKELKDILESAEIEELKSKTQELSDTLQKIGQYMYEQPSGQPENEDTKEGNEDKGEEKDDKKEDEDNDGPVEGEVVEE
jgi:molecular chaperone DnaK